MAKRLTREEMIKAVRLFYRQNSRFPTDKELRSTPYLPGPSQITNHFGGYPAFKARFLGEKGPIPKRTKFGTRYGRNEVIKILKKIAQKDNLTLHIAKETQYKYTPPILEYPITGKLEVFEIVSASTIKSFKEVVRLRMKNNKVYTPPWRKYTVYFTCSNSGITQEELSTLQAEMQPMLDKVFHFMALDTLSIRAKIK